MQTHLSVGHFKKWTQRLLCLLLLGPAVSLSVGDEPKPTVKSPTPAVSDSSQAPDKNPEGATESAIREQLKGYVAAFNQHDAAAVGAYWATDGVSANLITGDRTTGREALVKEFADFFTSTPTVRLVGAIDNIVLIRPDVASVNGKTTLFLDESDSVESAFSAVLVKEADKWLISSSHEQGLQVPENASRVLDQLDWLVGTWQDESDAARVTTTVRWSPNRTFLIRSFSVQFGEGEGSQGTQIIGWDPLNQEIRTWMFHSNGSFGEGTAAQTGNEVVLRMTQILSDGSLSSGTQIITRINEDSMMVQNIGQTIDGEPIPSSEPVTVKRIDGTEATAGNEGGQK